MNQQLPFFGHSSELAFIDSLVHEWGTNRVVCIDAPDGGGKTSLLHELRHRYTNSPIEKIPLSVTTVLDFNDPALHKLQNLGCVLATMLGEKLFEPYLRVLSNWRKMEMSGVSFEQLAQAALAVNQTFVSCFNMITPRVIILADSVEKLLHSPMLDSVIRTASQLQNVIFVIAGRNIRHLSDHVQALYGKEIKTIVLSSFPDHTAEEYIHHKEQIYYTSLDPDMVQKIIVLSQGRPTMLDLAMKRFAKRPPPQWLAEASVDDLKNAPDKQQQQHDFERELAMHIAHTEQLKGWLTLLLAHISPLDIEMIAELLAIPEDTARGLFAKTHRYADVQKLPYERICLHQDAMHIVNTYAWPEVDPAREQRRRHSRLAVTYMRHKVVQLLQRIDELKAIDIVEDDLSGKTACQPFLEITALEQEVKRLRVGQLYHTLFADPNEGINTFARMFDEATHLYDFDLRRMLLVEMEPHISTHFANRPYEVEIRRVIQLLDDVDYAGARTLTTHLLERDNITAQQQIALLMHRGNANIRLGHIEKGIADFNQALSLSHDYNLQSHIGHAQHARGWGRYNQGRYDLALNDYLEAYQHCLSINDSQHIAWILNDISFVHALRGNRHAALESCYSALELWEEIHYPRGLAATYTTLGEIYVRFNQPTDALTCYTKALDIFARQNDTEWMSYVRSGRAFALQTQREFDRAAEEQAWALKHGPMNLRPRLLYSQALSYLMQHDVNNARMKLEECRAISQQLGDSFTDYKSFADLIELAWDMNESERWREFHDEHQQLYAHREGIDALRLRGSCLRKIADLAICNGDYDDALNAYEHGLPLIAEYEVHERYTIRSQIKQTDSRLRNRIPGKVLHALGQDLSLFWSSREELVTKYPEVLLMFRRW